MSMLHKGISPRAVTITRDRVQPAGLLQARGSNAMRCKPRFCSSSLFLRMTQETECRDDGRQRIEGPTTVQALIPDVGSNVVCAEDLEALDSCLFPVYDRM